MKNTVFILLLMLSILLCGCGKNHESDSYFIDFYTDPITKVEYVVYNAPSRGGICPRYNPDGSLFVRGEQE